MTYFFSTILENITFEEAITKTKAALKEEGFGVLSEINIKDTLKNKLDVDLDPYIILGACSPKHAYEAIKSEPNIGVFLPCNVIVKQVRHKTFEVSAVDPIASMGSVENKNLGQVAKDVEGKLKKVIARLK
ncbi:DUF302 domain-containing protein [Xanthomarina sp. F2636L]|uniref:DUF302 domain-containing protein n=1 Tax=Xanthomarina sp. F2636L TaxID=2996018 RepID=UPI00225DD862|nr:DUF302 domain-containing protein [Xanthomarina sp. F2636L]MCX7551497.1 DUF302 domain-containing protein [Xanthomarina sp. F2636L]